MSETIVIDKLEPESLELYVHYENPHIHGLQTLKCLDAMRKERQFCDIIFTVEGHELFAHRALLLCHSNYFLELFQRDENDLSSKRQIYYQIDGLGHEALKLILQFIYQGSFQLIPEMVPEVYLAAHQLRVETIFKACSNYLAQQLNVENCLSVRLLAIDDDLRARAMECIEKNFLAILETREFHLLPSIKLDLVDYSMTNAQQMCELILHWIVQQLRRDHQTIQELGEYTHLLYLNADQTFHDCADMDEKNNYFCDMIKDYQSYKVQKRNYSNSDHEISLFEKPNLKLINNNLPVNGTNHSSINETKCIHMEQSTEYNYIAIAIVDGKMLSITIHLSPLSLSIPNTPDTGDVFLPDHQQSNNHFQSCLMAEKDIPLATLSTARCGFGIVSTTKTIFALGGYDRGDCLDSIEQFNPLENKWTLLAIPMTTRRGRVSAAILQNKIYVCGGSDGQQELNTGEMFDLESMDKWMPIKDLPKAVVHGAMCNDESFFYLIGGCEGDKCKNDCYQYDPQTNLWTALSPMNHRRSQAAAVYFDGRIYVFGGYTANRCLASCEIFYLSTNEWFNGPTMREHRRGCGAIVYDGKIFVIGGSNGVTSLTSIEIFDPTSNEWLGNITQELHIPRVGLGIVRCQEKLYVVGGFDGRTFLKSSEVYDENEQRWKLTTSSKSDAINNRN